MAAGTLNKQNPAKPIGNAREIKIMHRPYGRRGASSSHFQLNSTSPQGWH